MPRSTAWTVIGALCVGLALACGGGTGTKPTERKNPNIDDQAERARLRGEYPRAEAMLKARIKQNPNDHVAWMLLGDVNLTRGQHYARKWKENLARAFKAYGKTVEIQPDNCVYWARVASVVEMARMAEAARIPREDIEALPLDQGWEKCASAALFSLSLAREPYSEELDAVREAIKEKDPKAKPTDIEVLQLTAPWLKEAFDNVPLGHVEWAEPPEPAPLKPGGKFVVLETPLRATGQGHDNHRPVSYPEIFTASRISGGRAIFVDRRFPKLLPQQGVVLAKACKHSQWRETGIGKVPRGTCSRGPFLRSESPVWSPDRLKIASPSNYTEMSAATGKVPADEIHWETGVRCKGESVGRKIHYDPTCAVAYDQPNWLTRWVPEDKAIGAHDVPHAEQMIRAWNLRPIMGEELADRMVKGQVGIGMPYGLLQYAFPDLKGCQGRAILNRHLLNGGQVDFACTIGDTSYHFTDLQLVFMGPAEAGQQPKEEDDLDL